MYTCHIKKTIWQQADKQSGFTHLCYDLQNSEQPYVGEELSDRRWYSGRLTHVIWNSDYECFVCQVADEVPYHNGNYEYDYDWLVAAALAAGWQRCP